MVQSSDITIGSLIKTNIGNTIRIDSISTKRQHRKVGYHNEGDPYHIHYVRLTQCEGIPLTEEILLSNGFELNKFGKWMNDYFDVALSVKDGNYFIWERICVEYVHQLQTALRLVSMNKFADNFKV